MEKKKKNLYNRSFIRKSLDKDNFCFKKGIIWNVGNGNSINFWFDSWLDCGPLRNIMQGPLTLNENNMLLSSCLSNNHSIILLPPIFLLFSLLLLKTLFLVLPLISLSLNLILFLGNSQGNDLFSTSSAYLSFLLFFFL